MLRYVLKRIGLMLLTFLIIMTMCFVLIRLLPVTPCKSNDQTCISINAWREALGYNKPIIVQYVLYIKHVFQGDFGIGFTIYGGKDVLSVLNEKLPSTIYLNIWSSLIAIPIGILLGIIAALKKNKWQDQLISILVMLFISVPSYVYCFLIQYIFCAKLKWFPLVVNSGYDFWNPVFFHSYFPAMLCLIIGTVAGLTRYTRAELTEVLTSEFMVLARAKGLTRDQATWRHALRNAMVPIFPMILGEFISCLSGSLIIENFFAVPGVGSLYLSSINNQDYNFFMFLSMFYVGIGLAAALIIDLSYGWVDPRIRMGAK